MEDPGGGQEEEQKMQHQLVGPHAVVPPALPRRELAQGEEDGAAL